jgi:hypothetical protein
MVISYATSDDTANMCLFSERRVEFCSEGLQGWAKRVTKVAYESPSADRSNTLPLSEGIVAASKHLITKKVVLSIAHSEGIVAAIPNEEPVHCHHFFGSQRG